ncbi:hypothetical protein ES703_92562 [subsurface metagenome]
MAIEAGGVVKQGLLGERPVRFAKKERSTKMTKRLFALTFLTVVGCSLVLAGCDRGKEQKALEAAAAKAELAAVIQERNKLQEHVSELQEQNKELQEVIDELLKKLSGEGEEVKKEVGTNREPDVHFVPTPQDVVDKMLELANVKKDDLVYDLGCGDGRIVVTVAKRYGCKAVGYDIDPQRVKESLENVEKNNVGHLVRIEQKDIFTLDLSKANIITLYLLPSLNVKLIPQLEKLKAGSRIVSHDFAMEGIRPDKVVKLTSDEDDDEHEVYLWTSPLNHEDTEKELAPLLNDLFDGLDQ